MARPVPELVPGQPSERKEDRPVDGPVPSGWQESTLTRATELESLSAWMRATDAGVPCQVLADAANRHLEAARQAAKAAKLDPRRRFRVFRKGALIERASSNLDAAEAHLLRAAPPDYLMGQLASLHAHVRSHLVPEDPRRQEFERVVESLSVKAPQRPNSGGVPNSGGIKEVSTDRIPDLERHRNTIVAAARAASSAALREQVRARSFRNVIVVTTLVMLVLVIAIAVTGWLRPKLMPICFAPEQAGEAVVVCPTRQSPPFPTTHSAATHGQSPSAGQQGSTTQVRDINEAINNAVTPQDLLVVELVGLMSASVASAASIRNIRGSSERHGLPVALAVLKLPTGAVTAFLGLLLMRGQFVPGLSALDTSAQILAWAVVFGYAQQIFTRLVDRQGQVVLDSTRRTNKQQPGQGRP